MKKHSLLRFLLLFVGMAVMSSLSAQIVINSVSDSTAVLDEDFTATVDWSPGTGSAPTGWALTTAPDGMTINSSGVISYHPTNQADGGRVVVQAYNSEGTAEYHFNVYISNAVSCDADVISYHKMDEAGGTSFADFAGGYDATSATAVSSGIGVVDGAIELTPSTLDDHYLTVPDADQYEWSATDGFTFSAWINPKGKINPGEAEDQILWMRVNYFEFPVTAPDKFIVFGLDGQGADNVLKPKFRFRDSGAGIDSSQTFIPDVEVTQDSLHHIAFAYVPNGSGLVWMRVFLDGVRIGNPEKYVDPATNFYMNAPATIGHMQWPTVTQGYAFNGVMDEVIVYNRVLTDVEIADMYADGLAGQAHCQPGNHAPEFINHFPYQINQGGSYDITLATNDIEDDPVTIGVTSIPDWMQYSSATKRLTNKAGRPDNDDVGEDAVVVTANDGTIEVTRTFDIEVINVNDPPSITSSQGNSTINEDVEFIYNFTWEDIDVGDDITVTAPTKPDWLTLNTSINRLSGTCTNDFLGTNASVIFPVTLRVEDLEGAFDEQSFNITVNNVNDAPVISGQNAVETPENTDITITPAVAFDPSHINDPDNVFPDDFTLTVSPGTNYTVIGNNVLSPAENFFGTLTVPISLSDGQATVSFTLTVEVLFVNDPPRRISDLPADFGDDYELYEYTLEVADDDPTDVVTMSASILPSWMTFDAETGYLSGTPRWFNVGDTVFSLRFTDGHVIDSLYHEINIIDNNSLPEITSTPAETWSVGEVYQYTLTATDKDENDELTFTVIVKPDFLTFTAEATQATLHGVPTATDVGSHPVQLQVSDGVGIDQQSFDLLIVVDALNSEKLGSLRVYPVPATTVLHIDYADLAEDAVFQVLNLSGRVLTEENLEYGSGKTSVDLSTFSPGMYIYRIIEGNEIATGKFLVK